MNQDITKHEWIDAKEASTKHKQLLELICINHDRMHRENELRQRKFFRGCYPDIG